VSITRSCMCWFSRNVPACFEDGVDERGLAMIDVSMISYITYGGGHRH